MTEIKIRELNSGAAHFMGNYDGGTIVGPMFMRNRMTFAPADGVTNGKGSPAPSGEKQSGAGAGAGAGAGSAGGKGRIEEALNKGNGGGEGGSGEPPAKEAPNPEKPEDPEKARLLREVMKNKEDKRKLQEQIAAYGDISAEEVRQIIAERKESSERAAAAERAAEEERLRKEGDYEQLRLGLVKEHESKIADAANREKTLKEDNDRLKKQIDDLTVGASFDSSPFIRSEMILTPTKARIVYGNYFDVDEKGRVVGFDRPRGSSDRTPFVTETGDPLSFNDALRRIVESDPEKDDVLRSGVRNGTGSRPSTDTTQKSDPKVFGAARINLALSKKKS